MGKQREKIVADENEIKFKTTRDQLGEVFATLDNLSLPEVVYPTVTAFMEQIRALYPDRKPPTLYDLVLKAKARRAGLAKDGGPVLP
jgi:hypothetical protein